jgi:hypothetical protein
MMTAEIKARIGADLLLTNPFIIFSIPKFQLPSSSTVIITVEFALSSEFTAG